MGNFIGITRAVRQKFIPDTRYSSLSHTHTHMHLILQQHFNRTIFRFKLATLPAILTAVIQNSPRPAPGADFKTCVLVQKETMNLKRRFKRWP